jgi:nucleoside-diphosphate-sugar epimerase
MRALVTGGAGFIGSKPVDAMIRGGASVVVLDDLSSGHGENGHAEAELIEADIADGDAAGVRGEGWRALLPGALRALRSGDVSLRYFNVYGPRRRQRRRPESPYAALVPLFIEALRLGQPPEVHGEGLQTRERHARWVEAHG